MCVAAVRLPLVIAELRGGLLPGSHPGPDGDGARDRLEVEEAHPASKRLQLARERGFDNEAPFGHRLELALLGEVQLLVRRQVADRRDPATEIDRCLLWPDPGEAPNVGRRLGPATADERALARLETVQADPDLADGDSEH